MKEAANPSKIICKASAIVSHVRKSTRATENLENFKELQTANVTRWKCELKIIQSLLDIPQNKIDERNSLLYTSFLYMNAVF